MARSATTSDTPTLDVVDLTGKKVGTVDLPTRWFTGDVNIAAMHQVVTAQLASARQGTAKTKTRGERRGGGRKPWRQKRTGRARHGSIRSPIWRKGGVAHGPTGEQNHRERVNKSMKRTALRSALTDRVNGGDLRVVRGLAFEYPRTRDAVAAIEALGLADRKLLVVLGDLHLPTWKSFRNLKTVHLLTVDQLNTYDVLRSDVVLFDEQALELIGTGKRSGTVPASTAAAPKDEEPTAAAPKDEEPTAAAPKDEEPTAEASDEGDSSAQDGPEAHEKEA